MGNLVLTVDSWNGATEIASYRIYGGVWEPTNYVGEQAKTGFETMTVIDPAMAQEYCFWQVMPIDKDGKETELSNAQTNVEESSAELSRLNGKIQE